jgi:hypothetical protein
MDKISPANPDKGNSGEGDGGGGEGGGLKNHQGGDEEVSQLYTQL